VLDPRLGVAEPPPALLRVDHLDELDLGAAAVVEDGAQVLALDAVALRQAEVAEQALGVGEVVDDDPDVVDAAQVHLASGVEGTER
jgi:hypothetical protein